MIWFILCALISLGFILAGIILAIGRVRTYRSEAQKRRVKAFAEMVQMVEKKKTEKMNVER